MGVHSTYLAHTVGLAVFYGRVSKNSVQLNLVDSSNFGCLLDYAFSGQFNSRNLPISRPIPEEIMRHKIRSNLSRTLITRALSTRAMD